MGSEAEYLESNAGDGPNHILERIADQRLRRVFVAEKTSCDAAGNKQVGRGRAGRIEGTDCLRCRWFAEWRIFLSQLRMNPLFCGGVRNERSIVKSFSSATLLKREVTTLELSTTL